MTDLFGNKITQKKESTLQKKVERAIRLIRSASDAARLKGQVIEVAFSGGKDSCVILELTKLAGVPYRAIYKNTTIDPPKTINFCLNNACEIIRPKDNFKTLLSKYGYPNRSYRHCCGVLKEYKVLDYAILGIRKSESTKRAKRYKEPEQCREYSKTQKVRQYMPILDWTDEDLLQFIKQQKIKLHPLYYKENGDINI